MYSLVTRSTLGRLRQLAGEKVRGVGADERVSEDQEALSRPEAERQGERAREAEYRKDGGGPSFLCG